MREKGSKMLKLYIINSTKKWDYFINHAVVAESEEEAVHTWLASICTEHYSYADVMALMDYAVEEVVIEAGLVLETVVRNTNIVIL